MVRYEWHLGKQNIFYLTTMSKGINLLKSLLTDACSLYSKAKIHVESHQDKIEPGQYLLDLIYSDISSPYLQSCSEAKYCVIFLMTMIKPLRLYYFLVKMEYW